MLFDANSLLLLIRTPSKGEDEKSRLLRSAKVLSLTYYEVGNALLKESGLIQSLSEEELKILSEAVTKVLALPQTLNLSNDDFPGILELARSERLTFYDSSYVYCAKKNNLTFVTDDRKLSKISKKYAKTKSVHELL